jgi:alkanesulfonate monooxygenase SsuD/methylene tetrahydromethanopterin reductase-like flavin-dependent oxidoreductase (luciferase family)
MKVGIFTRMRYFGPKTPPGWPTSPAYYDRDEAMASVEFALQLQELAHRVGFHFHTFAEHHYNSAQLSPNPMLYAAALAQRLPGAEIGILGTDLPITNPVRVAEEYAILDHLTGGRSLIGLLRGTPNEYMTYGTNPWESRGRFEEGVLLIKKALTEPEPFGWEGRYYRYRTISIWPHAYQVPHPPMLISCSSTHSAAFAAENHLDVGFEIAAGFSSYDNILSWRECYLQTAAKHGWTPTADNMLCRQRCLVADTDDEAARLAALEGWPPPITGSIIAAGQPEVTGEDPYEKRDSTMPSGRQAEAMTPVVNLIRLGMAGIPKNQKSQGRPTPHTAGPLLLGSPATVARQIQEQTEFVGNGRLELTFMGGTNLPQDAIRHSVQLFGEEVIPRLASSGDTTELAARYSPPVPSH